MTNLVSGHVDGRVDDVGNASVVQRRVGAQQVVEEVIACAGLKQKGSGFANTAAINSCPSSLKFVTYSVW